MLKKLMALVIAVPLAIGLAAAPAVADTARPVLAGVVHGEGTWSYTDGHTEAHTADVGLVVSVDDGSITVIRRDRVRVTMPLPDTTCVRIDGYPAGLGDLAVGMRALVFGQRADDGSGYARVVRAGAPFIRWNEPTRACSWAPSTETSRSLTVTERPARSRSTAGRSDRWGRRAGDPTSRWLDRHHVDKRCDEGVRRGLGRRLAARPTDRRRLRAGR